MIINECILSPKEYKRFMKDMKNFKPKTDEYWNRKISFGREIMNRLMSLRERISTFLWLRKQENRDYAEYGCTDWREW